MSNWKSTINDRRREKRNKKTKLEKEMNQKKKERNKIK